MLMDGLASWLEYECMGAVEPRIPGRAMAARVAAPEGQPMAADAGVLTAVGAAV